MKFITSVLLFFSLFLISKSSQAQSNNLDFNRGNWTIGGGFDFNFTESETFLVIAPQLGYNITPKWTAGIRFSYNYYQYHESHEKFHSNMVGLGAYTIYEIFYGLFVQFEDEYTMYLDSEKNREFYNKALIGAGYRIYIAGNGYMSASILYNLTQDKNDPSMNPIYRVGVGYDF